jgi:hypothetical protein
LATDRDEVQQPIRYVHHSGRLAFQVAGDHRALTHRLERLLCVQVGVHLNPISDPPIHLDHERHTLCAAITNRRPPLPVHRVLATDLRPKFFCEIRSCWCQEQREPPACR